MGLRTSHKPDGPLPTTNPAVAVLMAERAEEADGLKLGDGRLQLFLDLARVVLVIAAQPYPVEGDFMQVEGPVALPVEPLAEEAVKTFGNRTLEAEILVE